MEHECLLPELIYSQMIEGKCSREGQKKRFKDVMKANLKRCSIEVTLWEETAKDRPLENRHYQLGNCNSRSEKVSRVGGKKKA